MTKDEVLGIVRLTNGWVSGAVIHAELVRRSWTGRTFGEHSLVTAFFGPGLGRMHDLLGELEQAGELEASWNGVWFPRRRVYKAVRQQPSAGRL